MNLSFLKTETIRTTYRKRKNIFKVGYFMEEIWETILTSPIFSLITKLGCIILNKIYRILRSLPYTFP